MHSHFIELGPVKDEPKPDTTINTDKTEVSTLLRAEQKRNPTF